MTEDLKEQIRKAQAEMATWSEDKRKSVRLEGSDPWLSVAPTQGADARPAAIYQVEQLAREVEVECLAGSGVSFYMAAEMAIERTIKMLAGPSMQIAEVCQDADGFKHIESVIEDLDDIPAGTSLYATLDAAPSDAMPTAWMVTNVLYGSVSFHTEESEARAFKGRQYKVEALIVASAPREKT